MIYLTLFFTFFKIGLFTFGGGYAMLPLIQAEVKAHEWLTGEELVNFIAVSESTPGPFAINISTYVGTSTGGLLGAFCATLGVVLPSFIIILIVARFYEKFSQSRLVVGAMQGLRPAVVGLIASAVLSAAGTVFSPVLQNPPAFLSSLVIFALATGLALKKVHPILVILLSAFLGIFSGYVLL